MIRQRPSTASVLAESYMKSSTSDQREEEKSKEEKRKERGRKFIPVLFAKRTFLIRQRPNTASVLAESYMKSRTSEFVCVLLINWLF